MTYKGHTTTARPHRDRTVTAPGLSDGCAIVIVMSTIDCVSATPRQIWLDFGAIDARCAELGATSDVERARLLRTTPSSLSRWRRGVMDITLSRAAELAEAIGLTLHDIVAASPRPSRPYGGDG